MILADLPSLRETLEAYGLLARKSFGQHFLLDLNITRLIARQAGVGPVDTVIEIGPGPGGLTRALLEAGVAQVIAIEKDERFVGPLQELAHAAGGRLTVVVADALKVDEAQLLAMAGVSKAAIVANLPYNVATPLLIRWLKAGPWRGAMTLMFQKEVAQRMCAAPGEAAYGRLAVLTRAACSARMALHVPARAFVPPPKVDSAVVQLTPLPAARRFEDTATLEQVTQAAFGQRRKMLRVSLRALGEASALIAAAGLDPSARPEDIPPEGFFALASALARTRQASS